MLKKIMAAFLVVCFAATSVPVFAADTPVISSDALRVSDEYAAQYPNGVFEFSTVNFETKEGAADFDVIAVRRGGTKGQATVNFKVIETSAKYGDDFSVLVPAWYGDKTLKKKDDSPTILESSLENEENNTITSEKYLAENPGFLDDTEQSDSEAAEQLKVTAQPEATEQPEVTEQPVTTKNTDYDSSLHELRDQALGKVSDSPAKIQSSLQIFDIENPEQIEKGEALNALTPGATGTLAFEDGENYKTFKIRINDDNIAEGPEQFTLGLFDASGGAVLGDMFTASCNIADNDEGVGQEIGFSQEYYAAYPADKKVELELTRSGDIYTYTKIELSTLSDTAKADEHYAPVMCDSMFLPGETSKRVVIPLITDSVSEMLSFQVAVTQDGKPTSGISRAVVNIMPGERSAAFADGGRFSLMSANSTSLGTSVSVPTVTYYGNEFAREYSFGINDWNEKSEWSNTIYDSGTTKVMTTWGGVFGYTGAYKWIDLRGMSGFTIDWANVQDGANTSNESTIKINDSQYYALTGTFDGGSYLGKANNFPRQQVKLGVGFATKSPLATALYIRSVTLYKQQFPIQIEAPAKLSYNTWNGDQIIKTTDFDPGTVVPSNSSPYRDETVRLTPQLSADGQEHQARLKGYRIKTGSGYSDIIPSDTITLTPEFITSYIYGNGTEAWNEKLIIQPVFERIPGGRLVMLQNNATEGDLLIGGKNYTQWTDEDSNRYAPGDVVLGELQPKTGYTAKGVECYYASSEYDQTISHWTNMEVKDIPVRITLKEAYTDVKGLFAENDKSVSIEWKAPDMGETEPRDVNIARGIIMHDHPSNMPQAEKDVLYKDVPEQPSAPNIDSFTDGGITDFAAYYDAEEEYRTIESERQEKILQNYSEYRNRFSAYTLEKLAIGDLVTLYAQPQEGYTVNWVIEEEGNDYVSGLPVKCLTHIGSSFTFEVTNELRKVYYYFAPVNTAGNTVFSGKVIRSKNTIKNQKAYAVNVNDPSTYVGVPGISVNVGAADINNSSIVKDGITYGISATTDNNGDFNLYMPYAINNTPYSVKILDGEKSYAQSVLPNKRTLIELPFMDNFKVNSLDISGVKTTDTTVNLENRQATITLTTASDDNRIISRVRLRSYDEAGGLWKTMGAAAVDAHTWTINGNLQESFKNNGRLTVELYDDRDCGHGEIESGYTFITPPAENPVTLPDINMGDGTAIDPMGTVNPTTTLGTRSLKPVQASDGSNTYTIAVKAGETFKKIIEDNAQDFDNKTTFEKVKVLAEYKNDDRYSGSISKEWGKSGSDGGAKTKTGAGKGSLDFNYDLGFYIQITRQSSGSVTDYYFDYAIIYIGAELSAQQDFTASIMGIPVYMRLRGSGSVKGIIMAEGGDNTKLDTAYGWFPTSADLTGGRFAGLFGFNIVAAIGAGVGTRGVLSAGLEGEMKFDCVYEPWDNGAGTLTFALNAEIDLLIVPIKFTITKHTIDLFRTDGYEDVAWMDSDSESAMMAVNEAAADVKATAGVLGRAEAMSLWNTASGNSVKDTGEVEEATLMDGVYKHPQPKIIELYNNKKIMFFLNDDLSRGSYDRTALYYSVYDGSSWSEPTLLQNDGRADYEPYANVVNDKVLVTWSGSQKTFGDTLPQMSDMLNSTDIYSQFFDMEGQKIGDTEQLTFDSGEYGNSLPKAAYDEETGTTILLYVKTDYNTDNVTYDDPSDAGDYLHNSYSTVAYRLYKDGEWQTSYDASETTYLDYEKEHGAGSLHGQRFIDFDVPNMPSAKISEISLGTYDGEAQFIYTYDIDNDPATKDDTEMFMKVYSFSQKKFTPAIRLTDDLTEDSNPQQVQYGGKDYLFWNHNGCISYLDIYALINYDIKKEVVGGETYYSIKDAYKSFLTVSDEQNLEAAQSFTVTIGDDGNLYVVWNSMAGDDQTVRGRQLFAAVYDEDYTQIATDESGNPVYAGGWGKSQQLTSTPLEYNNEQSVCVDQDGIVTVVCRKFGRLYDTGTEDPTDTKESDTSALVERRFKPIVLPDITDSGISVYPEYPKAGEAAVITANAENKGLIPAKKMTFKFELYNGENSWTALGDDVVLPGHLAAGETASASAGLTMPDDFSADRPVQVRVTVWADDAESNTVQAFYSITPKGNIVIEDQAGYLVSDNKVRITGTLKNTGNGGSEAMKLAIQKSDEKNMTKAILSSDTNVEPPKVIKTIDVNALDAAETYSIDEVFDVADGDFNESSDAGFSLNIKEVIDGKETTVYSVPVSVHKEEAADTEISDIIVNDGNPITLAPGNMINMEANILPASAANKYKLHYTSRAPDILEVDPSSGVISAKKAGTAQILIEAEENDNSAAYLMGSDGICYDSSGNAAEFNDDGSLKNSGGDGSSGKISLSKTISVTVAKPSSGSSAGSVSGVTKMITGSDGITLNVKANATLTKIDISASINKLAAEGIEKKNIRIVSEGGTVTLEKNALNALAENMLNADVSLPGGTMVLSAEVLKEIASQAASNISISITGTNRDDGRPVIDASIQSGNKNITDFGGKRITLLMPYTLKADEDENAVVVYYVGEDGQRSMMANSVYKDGMVAFRTDHLSKFAVGYNKISFGDVSGWAETYVSYLAARNVVNGVGDGKFMPENPVTRAEFVKMLASLSGDEIQPVTESGFKDVDTNSWYAPYVSWASEKGYVLGVSDTSFAPDDKITREQIAVMIQRFMDKEEYGLTSKKEGKVFADNADISDYAKDAVAFLSTTGIISGRDNNLFAPKDNATRAESAKMLAVLLHTGLEAENAFWENGK